jgi:hypothetical protein
VSSGRLYLKNAVALYDPHAQNRDVIKDGSVGQWIDPSWDWVTIEQKLSETAVALVKVRPSSYLDWLAAAFRAGAVRIVIVNAAFKYLTALLVVLGGVWLALRVLQRLRGRDAGAAGPARGYSLPLTIALLIAVSFALSALLQCILVAPPECRYMAAAGVFLPLVPVVALFAVGGRIRALWTAAGGPAETAEPAAPGSVNGEWAATAASDKVGDCMNSAS